MTNISLIFILHLTFQGGHPYFMRCSKDTITKMFFRGQVALCREAGTGCECTPLLNLKLAEEVPQARSFRRTGDLKEGKKEVKILCPSEKNLGKTLNYMIDTSSEEEAKTLVKNILNKRGYLAPSITSPAPGIVYVKPGEKFVINDFDVVLYTAEGNEEQALKKELTKYLKKKVFSKLSRLASDTITATDDNLSRIKRLILEFLEGRGFLLKGLKVVYTVQKPGKARVIVKAVITSAKNYIYTVKFLHLPGDECMGRKIFTAGEDVKDAVVERMWECGINPYASNFEVKEKEREVILTFYQPFIIERVEVEGARTVDLAFLKKYKGKRPTRSLQASIKNKLIRSGVFSSVSVKYVPTAEDFSGEIMLVQVKELSRANLSASGGINTVRGIEGETSFNVRKLFRSFNFLGLEGKMSFLPPGLFYGVSNFLLYEGRGRLTFEEKNLMFKPINLFIWTGIEYRRARFYLKNAFSGGAELTTYTGYFFLRFGYFYEKRFKLKALEEGIEESGDIGKTALSLSFDMRNDMANPSKGGYAGLVVEYADRFLGSRYGFYKITGRGSLYIPMENNFVLRIFGGAGHIGNFSGKILPFDIYYFIGGAYTVRGIQEEEFVRGGAAVRYAIYNVEIILKLFENMSISVFNDGGVAKGISARGIEYSGLVKKITVGGGIRYRTPVGPLRLEIGINTSPARGESATLVHFSVGANI